MAHVFWLFNLSLLVPKQRATKDFKGRNSQTSLRKFSISKYKLAKFGSEGLNC